MLEAKDVDAPYIGARPHLLKISGRGSKPLNEIIVDGLLTITPETALRIIQTGQFTRQRPVRPRHVDALAVQMRLKEWTSGTQIHFGKTPDGELHLVNGQHRMHAVIKADASIQFQVLVTSVPNEADLVRLYRRHDRLTALRTVSDALTAEEIQDTFSLRTEIATACFKAVLMIDAKFKGYRHADPYLVRSDEARLRLAKDWWPIAAKFQEMTVSAPRRVKMALGASGPMAVALATIRYQPERAEEFWRGLAEDDGLRSGDPRKRYLAHIALPKARSDTGAAKAIALAWNHYFEGRSIEKIIVQDGPITILGTPFAKPAKN